MIIDVDNKSQNILIKVGLNLVSILFSLVMVIGLIVIQVEKKDNVKVRFSFLIVSGISSGLLLAINSTLRDIETDLKSHDYIKHEDRINKISASQYLNEQKYNNLIEVNDEPVKSEVSPINQIMKMFDEVEIKPEATELNNDQNVCMDAINNSTDVLDIFNWNLIENKDLYPNIAIIGKPGSGKSSTALFLNTIFKGFTIAIDPHYKKGNFPTADLICGKGRNYGKNLDREPIIPFDELLEGKTELSCLAVIKCIHNEMTKRYKQDNYENPNISMPITLILDEYNNWSKVKGVSDIMGELLREGRKVNIRIILLCHQFQVKPLGLEGEGDLRKSINQIRLNNEAIEEAKIKLNQAKFNTANYDYWNLTLRELKLNNRNCLVDETFAIIPDLSNFLNTINPDQVVLGEYKNTNNDLHTQKALVPSNVGTNVGNVGNYIVSNIQGNFRDVGNSNSVSNCPHCNNTDIIKWGENRSKCKSCNKTFSNNKLNFVGQ